MIIADFRQHIVVGHLSLKQLTLERDRRNKVGYALYSQLLIPCLPGPDLSFPGLLLGALFNVAVDMGLSFSSASKRASSESNRLMCRSTYNN